MMNEMRNELTKSELQTGDIVVTRGREKAVVIQELELFLFQKGGYETTDMYSEDLLSETDDFDCDIEAAYRGTKENPVSFENCEEGECLFKRVHQLDELSDHPLLKHFSYNEELPADYLSIVAKSNGRSMICSAIRKEDIGRFLTYREESMSEDDKGTGSLTPSGKVVKEPVPSTPSTPLDSLERVTIKFISWEPTYVLLYSRAAEEAYRERIAQKPEKIQKRVVPSAYLPDSGQKIYSKCIVCRMDENGELKSLENQDLSLVIMFFANGEENFM